MKMYFFFLQFIHKEYLSRVSRRKFIFLFKISVVLLLKNLLGNISKCWTIQLSSKISFFFCGVNCKIWSSRDIYVLLQVDLKIPTVFCVTGSVGDSESLHEIPENFKNSQYFWAISWDEGASSTISITNIQRFLLDKWLHQVIFILEQKTGVGVRCTVAVAISRKILNVFVSAFVAVVIWAIAGRKISFWTAGLSCITEIAVTLAESYFEIFDIGILISFTFLLFCKICKEHQEAII